jgi:cytochrome b561
MDWRNGPGHIGAVTRFLHWTMAFLLLAQLPLGWWIARMPPALDSLWLFGVHKTLGFCLLSLVVLRVLWHLATPVPRPLGADGPARRAARGMHLTLYALLLGVPLAGWVASSATGIDSLIFGTFVLPPIAPASEVWSDVGFVVHAWLAWALAVLVGGHAAAAVLRHDGTLRRMIRGRP